MALVKGTSRSYATVWRSRGAGFPYLTGPRCLARCVRRAPLRGSAMGKLMRRIVGASCVGIALVVLEGAWLASVCRRRRARERPSWV